MTMDIQDQELEDELAAAIKHLNGIMARRNRRKLLRERAQKVGLVAVDDASDPGSFA